VLFVDKLIFRHEDRREDRERNVDGKRRFGKGDKENECHADENAKGIDRMADPFPLGQSSSVMKIPFVKGDAKGLKRKGQKA
jgi:hypothetical protein